eukprot:CAMPEP_0178993602 /NCGR_PEP_ID=MMETSP0795-20121207/6793_1 /TAXON_ID=88552 /ORGANISM="Amoebophrya sp., Strain Ameob2" /LENGTH=329 /DNA_ID=CAMNT_0020685677 /DNA_START=214 /DNA_END=1203 /DNA_ORIENTATION=-
MIHSKSGDELERRTNWLRHEMQKTHFVTPRRASSCPPSIQHGTRVPLSTVEECAQRATLQLSPIREESESGTEPSRSDESGESPHSLRIVPSPKRFAIRGSDSTASLPAESHEPQQFGSPPLAGAVWGASEGGSSGGTPSPYHGMDIDRLRETTGFGCVDFGLPTPTPGSARAARVTQQWVRAKNADPRIRTWEENFESGMAPDTDPPAYAEKLFALLKFVKDSCPRARDEVSRVENLIETANKSETDLDLENVTGEVLNFALRRLGEVRAHTKWSGQNVREETRRWSRDAAMQDVTEARLMEKGTAFSKGIAKALGVDYPGAQNKSKK